MGRIPTMEERLQDTMQYVTPAHAADWSAVDKKNGDLLYVGWASNLRNRLNPSNHIMWSIFVHETGSSPLIRVALWLNEDVEAGITNTCLPLWSNHRGAGSWIWRDPDLILLPRKLSAPRVLHRTPGTYAWVCLPRGRTPRRVMIDSAESRRARCVQTPDLWRCPTPTRIFSCYYTRLQPPAADVVCPHCGLTPDEAEHQRYERSVKALAAFERSAVYRTHARDEGDDNG